MFSLVSPSFVSAPITSKHKPVFFFSPLLLSLFCLFSVLIPSFVQGFCDHYFVIFWQKPHLIQQTTSNKQPNLRTHLGDGEVTEMLRRKSLKEKRLRMQINVRVPQNTFGSSLLTPYLPITRFSAITAEMYWCRKSARNLQIYISPRFLTAIDSQAFDIHVLFSLQVSARGGC